MHRRITVALVLGALISSGCNDQSQPPTEPSQPSAATRPALPVCSTQGWLTDVKSKNALVFSGSLLSSANDKVTAIYTQCKRGAQADAKKKAIFFVDWMFKKYRAHQTKSSASAVDLANLTSAVLSGVGLQTGSISPGTFGPTGGAGSYDPAQSPPTTVTTINRNAGVQLPGTAENGTPAFAEATLITLIQLPDSPQLTGEGAPPGNQQFPPNYDINAINASGTHEFQAGAPDGVVSICFRPDIDYPEDVVIGHTTFAGVFEFLPATDPIAQVTCGAPIPAIGAALPPGLPGLARSAWRTATRYVGPVAQAIFLPQRLNAAARTGVASGSARSLSPFGLVTAPAVEGDFWTTRASMPTPRGAVGVAVINGILYAVGGANNSGVVNVLEAYDPATNTWTTKAPMPTARNLTANSVGVINGILYVVGGCGDACPTTALEAYDPVTNTWTTKAPMPTPRDTPGVGVINGILYAAGGSSSAGILDVVEAYDPTTNTWATKASMPTAHDPAAAGVVNGIFYVVGGQNGPVVEAYDPLTNTWTTKASMPTQHYTLGVAGNNGMLYAAGGGANSTVTDVLEAYDPVTNTWTTKASMPTARDYLSAAAVDGLVYAVGGHDQEGAWLATVEAYQP